jgi:hypothetical protein
MLVYTKHGIPAFGMVVCSSNLQFGRKSFFYFISITDVVLNSIFIPVSSIAPLGDPGTRKGTVS